MKIKEILKHVDHTLLLQPSTWEEIKQICDDAMKYGTASVCIPPCYVKQAAEYMGEKMAVCTVIGFPLGANTSEVKAFEATDAIKKGADEVDMVINIGAAKDGKWDLVESDIAAVNAVKDGRILKVIIETSLLTDEEKVKACQAAQRAGADFVKTSTGFSTAGAKVEDVKLMRETVGPDMGVKASGGIRNLEDAKAMIEAGANRLGCSSGVAIMEGETANASY